MRERNLALVFRYFEVLNRLGNLNNLSGLVFDRDITRSVRKALRPLGVKVCVNYSTVADHEQVIVSSYFDPSVDGYGQYELWLTYRSKGQFLHFGRYIEQLKVDIADSLVHEYVHCLQYEQGACAKDASSDLEYMSDDIEIDAYSVNCSYELVRRLQSNALQFDHLIKLGRMTKPTSCPYSFTLWQYAQLFKKDSPVWKQFLKKTYKNVSWLVAHPEICL